MFRKFLPILALLNALPTLATVPSSNIQTPSLAEVDHAISLAASYLERTCGPDGRFVYLVNINSGQQTQTYNIVRHSGAIYALGMLHDSQPDHQATDVMLRAAAFLRRNYLGLGVQPGQLVVWSKPLPQNSYADLGATGLGLVALAATKQVGPNSIPLEQLQALGRFALFLQRADGSFVSKYSVDGGPVMDFESLYYPGEAALGFLSLYELDHSPIWLAAAGNALSYLAKSPANLSSVPADHWALIATAKFLPYCDRVGCPTSRDALLRHATQICTSILHDQLNNPAIATLDGSFDATGRTTPAATRLEGLLAAMEFLPHDALRMRVEAAVERGIAFLLHAQITSGRYAGGMPGATLMSSSSSSDIRIDYVQHSLCAWLRYQQLLKKALVTKPS